MKHHVLVALALTGCGVDPNLAIDPSGIDPTCYHPDNYINPAIGQRGLVQWSADSLASAVDTGPSIMAAINDALANEGKLCRLPAGKYLVQRAPANTYNGKAGLSAHGYGIVVEGQGMDETTLVFAQDAELRALKGISFDPGCVKCGVKNLTIDGTGLYNTDPGEQTIAIDIGTNICTKQPCTEPVLDTLVENVRFLWNGSRGERWGDCVRVAGNTAASQSLNTRLIGLEGLSCGRSFVAWQRNANALEVSHSFIQGDNIGGTVFDGERTGGEGGKGAKITDNTILFSRPRAVGDDGYVISGTSEEDFQFDRNTIVGGRAAISCVRCSKGSISGNILDAENSMATEANIDVANLADQMHIKNNVITRRGGNGQCIKSQPHSGVGEYQLQIIGNTCRNYTDGAAIMVLGRGQSTVSGNDVVGNGGPNSVGIYATPSGGPFVNAGFNDNRIAGMTYSAMRLSGAGTYGFVATTVGLNTSVSSGPMRCENPQYSPPGGLLIGLNNWSTPSACVPQ